MCFYICVINTWIIFLCKRWNIIIRCFNDKLFFFNGYFLWQQNHWQFQQLTQKMTFISFTFILVWCFFFKRNAFYSSIKIKYVHILCHRSIISIHFEPWLLAWAPWANSYWTLHYNMCSYRQVSGILNSHMTYAVQ